MGKIEFLQQLEAGLGRAAPDERVAAMQYYSEYLDEAGPDREAEVLAELGDPKKLAEEILGASGGEPVAAGTSWTPPTPPPRLAHGQPFSVPPPPRPQDPFDQNAPKAPEPPPQAGYTAPGPTVPVPAARPQYNQNNNRTLKIILFILIIVFLSPALGGLLGGLLTLLCVAVLLAFLPFIIAVVLVAAGIATIVVGGIVAATTVGTGLVAIGSGVLAVGLGLLCFMAGIQLMGKALPAMFRGVFSGIRFLMDKVKNFLGTRGESNG